MSFHVFPDSFAAHNDLYGAFSADVAFFQGDEDPFRRGPSSMPYDRQAKKHVLNDGRTFIVGLSDEGGAGANVGFATKVKHRPSQSELDRLDAYISKTLWGLQLDGAGVPVSLQEHSQHGVRSSMFWSVLQPVNGVARSNESGMPGYDYKQEDFHGWQWDRARGFSTGRAYNYPHQTVSYYALYHALRDNDKLSSKSGLSAQWALKQAASTIIGMWSSAGRWYSQMVETHSDPCMNSLSNLCRSSLSHLLQGLMAGTVFLRVLEDLEAEAHPAAPTVKVGGAGAGGAPAARGAPADAAAPTRRSFVTAHCTA